MEELKRYCRFSMLNVESFIDSTWVLSPTSTSGVFWIIAATTSTFSVFSKDFSFLSSSFSVFSFSKLELIVLSFVSTSEMISAHQIYRMWRNKSPAFRHINFCYLLWTLPFLAFLRCLRRFFFNFLGAFWGRYNVLRMLVRRFSFQLFQICNPFLLKCVLTFIKKQHAYFLLQLEFSNYRFYML